MRQLDKTFGWETAIPEPYWTRRFFRWFPSCYKCEQSFDTKLQYQSHWLRFHNAS